MLLKVFIFYKIIYEALTFNILMHINVKVDHLKALFKLKREAFICIKGHSVKKKRREGSGKQSSALRHIDLKIVLLKKTID